MRSHARIWPRFVSFSLGAFACAFAAPRAFAQLEDPTEGRQRIPLARARPIEPAEQLEVIDVARDLAYGDAEHAARAACAARTRAADSVVPDLRAALVRWTGRTTDPLARHVVRLVLDALHRHGANLSPEELVLFVDDDAELDLALLFAARDPVRHAWQLRRIWPRVDGELQKVCANLLILGDRDEFVRALLDELKFELRVTVEDPPDAGTSVRRTSCFRTSCGRATRASTTESVVAGVPVPVYTFTRISASEHDVVAPGPISYRVERSESALRQLPTLAPRVRTFDAAYALSTLRALAGDLTLRALRAEPCRVVHQGRDALGYFDEVQPVCNVIAADWTLLLAALAERGVISPRRAQLAIPLTVVVDDRRAQPAPRLPAITP